MNYKLMNWVGRSILGIGCTLIAVSPTFAGTSVIPFCITIFGQVITCYASRMLKDWSYVAVSILFMIIDCYAIYIRYKPEGAFHVF